MTTGLLLMKVNVKPQLIEPHPQLWGRITRNWKEYNLPSKNEISQYGPKI